MEHRRGAGFARPRPGLAPEVSAQVASLQSSAPSAPVSISLAEGQAFVKLVVVADREE